MDASCAVICASMRSAGTPEPASACCVFRLTLASAAMSRAMPRTIAATICPVSPPLPRCLNTRGTGFAASSASLNPSGMTTANRMADRSSAASASASVRSSTSISSSASSRMTRSRACTPPSRSTTLAGVKTSLSLLRAPYIRPNSSIGRAMLNASSARLFRNSLSSRRAM